MPKFDVRFDVSSVAPFGEPVSVAASVFVPDSFEASSTPMELMVCLHGGTYSRFYYDAQIPGYPGYSFAEHFVAQGRIVLTIDALGMGASSQPAKEELLSPLAGAHAHHLALQQALDRIRSGRFGAAFGNSPLRVTGIGHSMGGMLSIIQQAAFKSFDRLAVLGWTNIGLAMSAEVRAQLDAQTANAIGYLPGNRPAMRAYYHATDVPEAVIAADDAQASLTPAGYGRKSIKPRILEAEAASIETPVFLHYGDIDVSPDPQGEVAFYRKSRHITLTLLPDSAHCHNFATTRMRSWQELDHWITATP